MATCDRGEGVHLLPESRWKDYVLPPQLLTRSPGHMLDWVRACKGGERSCSDFSITAPYAEWLALTAIALHVPGKLEWDSRKSSLHQQSGGQPVRKSRFFRWQEVGN